MRELFARLSSRPGLTVEMLIASLLANVLGLASSMYVIQVLNRYIAHGVDATLATLTAGVVIAIILEIGFRHIRLRLGTNINASYDHALSSGVMKALTSIKTESADQLPPGVSQSMLSGADKMQMALSAANICTIMDVPFAIMFVGVLYLLSPTLAFLVIFFLLIAILISVFSAFSLRGPSARAERISGRRGALAGTAMHARDTIRAFNARNLLLDIWQKETRALHRFTRLSSLRQGLTQTLGASIQGLMGVGVICTGAVLVVSGDLDVGMMIGANILASRALGPMIKFASLNEAFAKANQSLELFKEFAKIPMEKQQGTGLSDLKGDIEFQDVAYVHPGSKTPLFEHLSLKIGGGSGLVFAGINGSGKTTLARLLVGLLEPTRGNILIDGVDLQQLSPEWWRRQIIYLPQEPSFLNTTFAENLKTANPDADEPSLNRAIEMAGLRAFVDQSAEGLQTQITNGGSSLSLGIRRRLALARALVTDGQVLIIDEPTEALDPEGIQVMFNVLNHMAKQGRTVLVFSHDPVVLQSAPQYMDLNIKPTPRMVQQKPPEKSKPKTKALTKTATTKKTRVN